MLIFKLFSKDLLDEKGVAFWAVEVVILELLAHIDTIHTP